jgi:exodeoxyribonuclease-3
MRIVCWNVNGIRAISRKGFVEYVEKEAPDVICLQETKASPDQLDETLLNIPGYESHFVSGEKKGYSGVAIYTKPHPVSVMKGCGASRFDCEGRVISADYGDFILYNIYFPNGGRGPERVRYKLDFYDHLLETWEEQRAEGRELVICGDYNTAHQDIDVARPKEWSRQSGFLPEEREWLDKIVDMGYVDVFRQFNTEPNQYTYWDAFRNMRERNIGWRIDYFFVTPGFVPRIRSANIYPAVLGSDHCPIDIVIDPAL